MDVYTVNPKLPKRAGRTKLEFYEPEREGETPHREKDTVFLPLVRDASFHPLLKGDQFLYKTTVQGANRYQQEEAMFFGGTDEEPFLARLNPAIKGACDGTEAGFFQALVPEMIQRGMKVFANTPRRQGDIFALPTDLSWSVVKTLIALKQGTGTDDVDIAGVKDVSVFDTRHRFTGMRASLELPGLGSVVLAEGELKAPDHADVKLPRIHILRQAAFLFDPRNAD